LLTEPLASSDPGAQKRRSTRIVQAVPITVTGVDALGQPFKERTTTTAVNCHGCKYQSKHYVPKNAVVTLDIPRPEPTLPARTVRGRVIWVQRPRTVRELFQIGVEFDIGGNVWGIAFPPDDWFPVADEQPAIPAGSASIEAAPKSSSPIQSAISAIHKATEQVAEKKPEAAAGARPASHAPANVTAARTSTPEAPAKDQSRIHVVTPQAIAPEETQAALDRHVAKLVTNAKEALDKSLRHEAQAAINDEMTIVRQQLDVQLHDAVEKAIRVSMERVSESAAKKVVQDAADRTKAIVEEARTANEANAVRLDAKVREAVQQAVSGAAEQAAQEAARQTAALNLKETVENAVEKALSEREASSPSLQILSSPEAAQKQIDEWKKSLEETAQSVRQQSLEKSETEAVVTAQRFRAEFENSLKGASQKMQEQLAEASQAALKGAEQDASARNAALQAAVEETLSNARSSASALAVELAAERARTETAALQLQNTTQSTLENTRRELDQLLGQQVEEINRRADQAIEQRAQQIDPIIEKAAQKTADRLSVELDQKVAAKIEETRRAVSELAEAKQQADQSRESIRSEAQLASDQIARLQEGAKQGILDAQRQADQSRESIRSEAQLASDQIAHLQEGTKQGILDAQRQADQSRESIRTEAQLASDQIARLQESATQGILDAQRQADQSRESIRTEAQLASDQVARLRDTVREEVLQASEQALELQQKVREQAAEASEQAIQEALGRLKEESGRYPTEVENSCREVLSQVQAEFEQKATATEHATYEALLKASEWYQKKAHTTMQSSMERAVEQSTTELRDRAAEVSSLLASELDHYRRTYLEHSQAQIEEAANELVERERAKLTETAEIANATFTDRVQRTTDESLRRLNDASRETAEKARSDMEFSREGALTEFQKGIDERLQRGVDEAKEKLQAQLQPLMQTMDATWQAKQREWIEHIQRSTDESIEQYKTRLENASNSWLLASATTLGQHSQAVLDTIAKAAEKRLRDTCRNVLAGMGDTLKERMLGLSSGFASEDEEDEVPPEK
jgi:hypothetical protein